jgi:hypothetical protein
MALPLLKSGFAIFHGERRYVIGPTTMKRLAAQLVPFFNAGAAALPPPWRAVAAYVWSRTAMVQQINEVLRAIEEWRGVAVAPNRSGLCLSLNGVHLGHLNWNGRVVIPFESELRDRLVSEGMAAYEPDLPGTERVVFDVRSAQDVERALWLLRLSYLNVGKKQNVCD